MFKFIKSIFNNKDENKGVEKIKNDFCDLTPDILEVLWIKGGIHENYFERQLKKEDFTFLFHNSMEEEPSLIYIDLPLVEVKNIDEVEKIGYFPTYKTLTAEQRFIYLNWLADPFKTKNIDMGYVFLFYYGLERHLYFGNSEKALKKIIELLDFFDNDSLKYYGFNALITYALIKNNEELLFFVLKKYKKFSNNELGIFCKAKLGENINSQELIDISYNLGFTNKRYIQKEYNLFCSKLDVKLIELYGKPYFEIKKFLATTKEEVLVPPVANISLRQGGDLKILNMFSNDELKKTVCSIFQEVHDEIKIDLRQRRKKN